MNEPFFKNRKAMMSYHRDTLLNFELPKVGQMSAKIKHVVFDADGTIWTVNPGWVVARSTFVEMQSPDEAIIILPASFTFDGKRVKGEKGVVTLRPGFRNLLDELDSWGIGYSLATLSDEAIITPLLTGFGLIERFMMVSCAWERGAVLEAIAGRMLKIQNAELLLVDDSPDSFIRMLGFKVLCFGEDSMFPGVTRMSEVSRFVRGNI